MDTMVVVGGAGGGGVIYPYPYPLLDFFISTLSSSFSALICLPSAFLNQR